MTTSIRLTVRPTITVELTNRQIALLLDLDKSLTCTDWLQVKFLWVDAYALSGKELIRIGTDRCQYMLWLTKLGAMVKRQLEEEGWYLG